VATRSTEELKQVTGVNFGKRPGKKARGEGGNETTAVNRHHRGGHNLWENRKKKMGTRNKETRSVEATPKLHILSKSVFLGGCFNKKSLSNQSYKNHHRLLRKG